MNEDFWKTVDASRDYPEKSGRTGILNVALLFGTAAIALSLILTPMLATRMSSNEPLLASVPDDIDHIITGSIKRGEPAKNYTIRKSILPEHQRPCVIEGYNRAVNCD